MHAANYVVAKKRAPWVIVELAMLEVATIAVEPVLGVHLAGLVASYVGRKALAGHRGHLSLFRNEHVVGVDWQDRLVG